MLELLVVSVVTYLFFAIIVGDILWVKELLDEPSLTALFLIVLILFIGVSFIIGENLTNYDSLSKEYTVHEIYSDAVVIQDESGNLSTHKLEDVTIETSDKTKFVITTYLNNDSTLFSQFVINVGKSDTYILYVKPTK